MEEWGLGTLHYSMTCFLLSKLGNFYIIKILFFTGYSRQDFFPHCLFMEAKDSASGSYAWKIILKGREVIEMGSRFRVGNGKNIKIWQHHWLPIKHPPLVTSPIIESMEDVTVDCLIDENTGKWDAEMLEGILVPAEAAIAKKIPLARSPTEDTLFWPFMANGQYTCKSGYRLLKDLEEEAEMIHNRTWIEISGNAFGPWKFQTSIKTWYGEYAETLSQQN